MDDTRITIEPGKRSGQPCIRGLRMTVWDVLGWLAAGKTEEVQARRVHRRCPIQTVKNMELKSTVSARSCDLEVFHSFSTRFCGLARFTSVKL